MFVLNSTFLKRALAIGGIAAGAGAALVAGYMLFVIAPDLPAIDAVTDYRPKIPLRIYTADNALIGEFGEEHRNFVPVKEIPDLMKKAVLAIEDKRFYDHGGIDWIRMLGAVKANLRGSFRQGGSTITMQVARNFFLSRDKQLGRKLSEIVLSYKIESALTKDQILELYMNQIYLGQRSYGFASASQAYFSKPLTDLSIAEMAMLAGLPQNPARNNPAVNPKAARKRQHLILKAMREQDLINEKQYQAALKEVLHVSTKGQEFETHAEYVAELARQQVYAEFKEESYTRGISVYTTILKADQDAAYESVRRNVLAYDQRHGYRGPEAYIDLPADEDEREDAIDQALQKRRSSDRLIPAVVTSVSAKTVQAETIDGEDIDISGDGLKLAAPALAAAAKPEFKIRPGAVIRVIKSGSGGSARWAITQVPQVAAAFVSIDANTGGFHALVGGFDFNLQKFNHVTQAWRQPGSSIKPFIYSAALEKGYYPATLINDAPLSLDGGDSAWNPQNDDNVYDGPITMRTSLAKSKNVTTVRLLRAISVPYAHNYLQKFGFDLPKHPQNLTMALGTGSVTPQQLAGAYAVFANGGYQVQPYLIAKIVDGDGKVISETKPPVVTQESNRVLDPRNVFLADQMMREVVRSGTGAQAYKTLGRLDIAGKTGTTSDAMDGWFAGYGGGVVGVAWMGYDDPKSLGGREFGATLALPIWLDYMKVALQKRPPQELPAPQGLAQRDGEWLYSEYLEDNTVRAIDLDLQALPSGEAATAGAAPPQGEVNQPHQ
ncbi:penicillin-binding protein 1A [Pseudoduganella ginsengisoli]